MTVHEQRVEILKKSFERLKKQNPGFSLRALARRMNVTPAFLSKIFNCKMPLPFDRISDFVEHLKMDKLSERALLRTYRTDRDRKIEQAEDATSKVDGILNQYQLLAEKNESLLSHWYNLAILELAFVEDFTDDPDWISERLGISREQAASAVHFLKSLGVLVERQGKWRKSQKFIRIPATTSKSVIRDFHRQMLTKAQTELARKTGQTEYDARLIAGVSISTNPKNLARAISRYNEMMYEIADILHDPKATEVYYIGSLLFPLTVVKKKGR